MKTSVLLWISVFVLVLFVGIYMLTPPEDDFSPIATASYSNTRTSADPYGGDDGAYSPYDDVHATMTDIGFSAGLPPQ